MYAPATHPITAFAEAIHAELDQLTDLDPTYLSTSAKKDALLSLERARERLAGLQARIMANGYDVTADGAHRTVADFVSSTAHADRAPLASLERLGRALELRWRVLAGAVLQGTVGIDKAREIARALDLLREEGVPPQILAKAEAHLVKIAPDFPAAQVRLLARKVLEVVAPDLGEDNEARRLELEERRAQRRLFLQFRSRAGGVDGITEIRIRTSDAIAARLRSYLESLTAPRHLNVAGVPPEPSRPYSQRLGEAFNTLVETLDPTRLPLHGGNATTIMVTIPLAELVKDLGGASMSDNSEGETRISASQVRRLACNANILPAVLNGKSEILDLGRSKRLFTPPQRRAMAARDKTCRADGCTMPAPWCEAHHFNEPWSRGGKTNLRDGKLLCPWHHHRAHDSRYLVNEMPNGDVRFTRRR